MKYTHLFFLCFFLPGIMLAMQPQHSLPPCDGSVTYKGKTYQVYLRDGQLTLGHHNPDDGSAITYFFKDRLKNQEIVLIRPEANGIAIYLSKPIIVTCSKILWNECTLFSFIGTKPSLAAWLNCEE